MHFLVSAFYYNMLRNTKFKLVSTKNIKKKSILFTHFQFIKFGLHLAFLKKYWHLNTLNFLLKIENNYLHIFKLTKTILLLNKSLNFLKKNLLLQENILIVNIFINIQRNDRLVIVNKKFHKDLTFFTEKSSNIFYIGNKYWLPGFITNFLALFGLTKSLFHKQHRYFQSLFMRSSKIKDITYESYQNFFINTLKFNKYFSINLRLKTLFTIFQIKSLPEILITFDNDLAHYAIKEALLRDLIIITLINSNTNPNSIQYPIPINTKSFFSKKLFYILLKLVFLEKKIDYLTFFFK